MILSDTRVIAIAAALGLGIASALVAWVLRRARVPGGWTAAAMLGGVVVGLLAGPGVMGRVAPETHRALFVGGVKESRELEGLAASHEAERAALKSAGVTPEAIQEHASTQREELKWPRMALETAERVRSELLWWIGSLLAIVYCVIVLGPRVMPVRRVSSSARSGESERSRASAWRHAGVGLCGGVVCVLPPALALHLIGGVAVPPSVMFGVALGCCAVPLRGSRAIVLSASFGVAASAVLLMTAGVSTSLGLPAVCLAMLVALGPGRLPSESIGLLRIGLALVLPLVTALLTLGPDLRTLATDQAREFWTCLIVALLWSSDGRWGGYWLAWRLVGGHGSRSTAWRDATTITNAGAGVVQVLIAALLASTGEFSDSMIAGALLGGLIVEMTRGARRWVLPMLESPRG